MVKRLNYFWGFLVFGVAAASLFIIGNINSDKKIGRAEIMQELNSGSLVIISPKANKQLTISRPSEKLEFKWKMQGLKKLDPNRVGYIVKVYAPTGEMLIDEATIEETVSIRNLAAEGEYSWEIIPTYNGINGRGVKENYQVNHPELPFVGEIDSEVNLVGTIQLDGEVFFENGEQFYEFTWPEQKESYDEKYLIEVSNYRTFSSLNKRIFTDDNYYQWGETKNGTYYMRVTRISPFGELKGVSNTSVINVETSYPLPKIVKAIQKKNRIARKKLRRPLFKKKIAKQKKQKKAPGPKREPASIESQFQWKWSYLLPKEIMVSLGQGAIELNQSSDTTDANTSFNLQNIGLDARFQENDDFYIDLESIVRNSSVKNAGDFVDSFISLVVGKEWKLDSIDMSVIASIGGRYSNVNYFEQDFTTNITSKQDNIFSATAQAGVVMPIGESITNKLRVIVDVGALNQYGVKYNGRYSFASNDWFVDLSGGYFDGSYSLTDEFNEKSVDRSEVQFFMGIGRSFK